VIAYMNTNHILPAFTVLGEPTSSNFAIGNKGCFAYELIVKGVSCHSSQPQNGINAIGVAAKFAVFLEQFNARSMSHGCTCNVGVIEGGSVANKVPDVCRLVFDLRVERQAQATKALRSMQAKLSKLSKHAHAEVTLSRLLEIPPFEQTDSPFKQAIFKALPRKTFLFQGGSEAGFYQQNGSDVILFGCGNLALAHSKEEHVCIAELQSYSDALVLLLQSIQAVK